MARNESRFYKAMEDIFVGAPVEGEGGYVNLLSIKQKYYSMVVERLRENISKDPIITDAFQEDFYNLLYLFFEKYFSECGSVYFVKTANWQRVYEKVYTDTKDVVLFWKTHTLYYVKSDILFQSMYIKAKDKDDDTQYVFYFDVGGLQQKQNNEKKELVYSHKETRTGKIADVHDDTTGDLTFVLSVAYSERGRKTDYDALMRSTGIDREVIEKAIHSFERQTTVDFFINKNAKAFLEEQLELFLHQLLLEDESIFEQKRLDQIKAVKKYSKDIISFISQFENELVRIWNKPKFVKNANYVISIDRLNESLIQRIAAHPGLQAQIEEWAELGMVEKGFSLSRDEREKHPHLPIDTKYFKDLELEIIGQFDDLDEALNGRLIHSENYQALNTIANKYRNRIQCVYIDPPFNTGKDFDYIDGYQDATWLSLMKDRLELAQKLVSQTGGIFVHLDRYANYYSRILLNDIFGRDNYRAELYWDTCGNTGFKTSKNNWYQNTNCIMQYAKQSDRYTFNKLYTLLNVENPNEAKEERRKEGIGWLDLQIDGNCEGKNSGYVEQYDENGKLSKQYHSFKSKVDPIGMIWTDVLSFLYTQVGNNESYFFKGGQKPEHLMARIIMSQTNQNDFVMDYFSGIGTTVAVAHKLNRKYIGIEMGEHFYTFYDDGKRIGILGRMKNVVNGDATFWAKNPEKGDMSERKPQLSRQLNWQGGGFFKYYDLEQYEDTLSKAVYSAENEALYSDDPFAQYVFFADRKLTEVLDASGHALELDFDKLYENIDLPETISLIYGEPIERITEDTVKLANIAEPIKYNASKMDNDEKIAFVKLLKPLLWWGET